MSFDPTDKQWQVSEAFPPNKAEFWKSPMEEDGWIHAHNCLRMEIVMAIEAADAVQSRGKIKAWEARCLQSVWKAHCIHIHSHHENEDDLIAPFLRTRFHYPEKCVTDHDGLVKALDDLTGMIDDLKEGDSVEEIAVKLKAYQEMMLPHLKDEEDRCLPLMRAYFTQKEIEPLIQKIVASGPKIETGSFVYCIGEKKCRNEFMRQEGIPWFVWYLEFKGCLAIFKREFSDPIEALKSGSEPARKKSFWRFWNVM